MSEIMKALDELITLICSDLNISKPKVEIDKEDKIFESDTQLAAYDMENNILYLKKNYITGLDLYFVLAHELRHKYQVDNGLFDMENYKHSNECSLEEYNLQFVELDANAYAYLIMVSLFHRATLYKGLSGHVRDKIMERVKEIYEDDMEKSY